MEAQGEKQWQERRQEAEEGALERSAEVLQCSTTVQTLRNQIPQETVG